MKCVASHTGTQEAEDLWTCGSRARCEIAFTAGSASSRPHSPSRWRPKGAAGVSPHLICEIDVCKQS
eukprot:6211972-Pleurochrysis_carterae.AAC.2